MSWSFLESSELRPPKYQPQDVLQLCLRLELSMNHNNYESESATLRVEQRTLRRHIAKISRGSTRSL